MTKTRKKNRTVHHVARDFWGDKLRPFLERTLGRDWYRKVDSDRRPERQLVMLRFKRMSETARAEFRQKLREFVEGLGYVRLFYQRGIAMLRFNFSAAPVAAVAVST